MSPELAQAAIEFLNRTELRGREAPLFMAVLQALQRETQPRPPPEPPPEES